MVEGFQLLLADAYQLWQNAPNAIGSFLSLKWWTGFGGVAQAVAAVFSLVAVWQARKMLRVAEDERHEWAACRWSCSGGSQPEPDSRNPERIKVWMRVHNTGPGTSLDTQAQFTHDGSHQVRWETRGRLDSGRVVPAGELLDIALEWSLPANPQPPLSLSGLLSLRWTTRLGRKMSQRWAVCCEARAERNPNGVGLWRCAVSWADAS